MVIVMFVPRLNIYLSVSIFRVCGFRYFFANPSGVALLDNLNSRPPWITCPAHSKLCTVCEYADTASYPLLHGTDALRLPANRFTEFKESGNGYPFTLGDMAVPPLRVVGVGGEAKRTRSAVRRIFSTSFGGLLIPCIT